LALDRVKSISALSAHSAVKGLSNVFSGTLVGKRGNEKTMNFSIKKDKRLTIIQGLPGVLGNKGT